MKKLGRKHRPFFRICTMDVRAPRDGKTVEELGFYDPLVADAQKRVVLNAERVQYWLGVGAQPTDKVTTILKQLSLLPPPKKKKRKPRKHPRSKVRVERREREKAEARRKVEMKKEQAAKARAHAEAKARAEAEAAAQAPAPEPPPAEGA